MSKTPDCLAHPSAAQENCAPTPDQIRARLRAILTSPDFLGSKRSQQFLEYVCEKSMRGAGSTLKERTIAVEVFGRPPQSDLGEDTIVRVSAREVRKRLARYHSSNEGSHAEVRIDLPPGSYAPEFHFAAAPEPRIASPGIKPVEIRPRFTWQLAAAAVLLALVAVVPGVKLLRSNLNAEGFQRFWAPVFNSADPLLVAVAHPLVYHPSGRALKLSEESLPGLATPRQRAIQVPPEKLNGNDLIPVFNQYVGFGDMVAANEVSAMLATHPKAVRLRLASNVEFADLRRQPALLIGAVTNRWTMEMQQAWRFRFQYTPGTRTAITDTVEKRDWSIPSKDDGSASDDYLLVCRIRSGYTGALILVAAGLKQFGTEAAGRVLGDPEQLGPILRQLPAGWDSKNLQLVLRARVIGNTPAQPEVVATHVW